MNRAWLHDRPWIALMLFGMAAVSGCRTFRWSGYSKRRENLPQASRGHFSEATRSPFSEGGLDFEMPPRYPKTSEEHQAAARLYREKASRYGRLAELHRRMKAIYETAPREMARHCDELVKKYEGLAREFEELASSHEQEATTKQK